MSKILKRYNPDDYWDYRILKASQITSGQGFQRKMYLKDIKERKEHFDPYMIEIVDVSYRDGHYYCNEGQHTVTLLVDLFGPNVPVACRVFKGTTYEKDAELFSRQDSKKRKISSLEQINSLYESRNPMVVSLKSIAESYGFVVDFKGRCRNGQQLSNIPYLLHEVYEKKGEVRLRELLSIISLTWKESGYLSTRTSLSGLNRFLELYSASEYEISRLIKILRENSPKSIDKEARKFQNKKNSDKGCTVIVDLYNYKRKVEYRLPYKC